MSCRVVGLFDDNSLPASSNQLMGESVHIILTPVPIRSLDDRRRSTDTRHVTIFSNGSTQCGAVPTSNRSHLQYSPRPSRIHPLTVEPTQPQLTVRKCNVVSVQLSKVQVKRATTGGRRPQRRPLPLSLCLLHRTALAPTEARENQ